MHHRDEQHPEEVGGQHLGRYVRAEKLARLTHIRLLCQQEHGRIERGLKLHKTVNINNGYTIEYYACHTTHPLAEPMRQKTQQKTQHIEVEKKLEKSVGIDMRILIGLHRGIATHHAQDVHKQEKPAVRLDGVV